MFLQVSPTLISSLSGATTLGPLYYYSERLIWLQNFTHVVISDLSGNNKANLNCIKSHVNVIAVFNPELYGNYIEFKNMKMLILIFLYLLQI